MQYENIKKLIVEEILMIPGISSISDFSSLENGVLPLNDPQSWWKNIHISTLENQKVRLKIAIIIYFSVNANAVFDDLVEIVKRLCLQEKINVDKIDIFIKGVQDV